MQYNTDCDSECECVNNNHPLERVVGHTPIILVNNRYIAMHIGVCVCMLDVCVSGEHQSTHT